MVIKQIACVIYHAKLKTFAVYLILCLCLKVGNQSILQAFATLRTETQTLTDCRFG
ncbi:hypothetical protein X975_19907, partial [Stegodyphus mimosarum]